MQVEHYPTPEVLAEAAAAYIARCLWEAIQTRGRAMFVLSGGSTPRATYQRLTQPPYPTALPWHKVEIFFGDERCVPPDDSDSNYRMANEAMLYALPIPPENIHRMAGELPPQEAARAYEDMLHARLGEHPTFDLILLGLGNDGHTASLFPNTAALEEEERWVVANYVPALNAWRLTLTYPVLAAGREIRFLAAGSTKQAVLEAIHKNPSAYPAGRVRPSHGRVVWMVAP